jgi:hypothetical protein
MVHFVDSGARRRYFWSGRTEFDTLKVMAIIGDHEAKDFTHDGNAMIVAVAARVFPTGWASKITNCFDPAGSATVLLFRPDKSEHAEHVYYDRAGEVWWENTLRDILQSASAVGSSHR